MRCDVCGKFRSERDLNRVTTSIHYSLGPLFQITCTECQDREEVSFERFRFAANETTLEAV